MTAMGAVGNLALAVVGVLLLPLGLIVLGAPVALLVRGIISLVERL